jgi:GntR family transcriptional regulator
MMQDLRRRGHGSKSKLSGLSIDRSSFVPLYFQLAEILKERIESGTWLPGARFLSVSEIESEFNVSRTVIRPALSLLETDGQLIRVKGRGNFVAAPKLGVAVQGLARLLSAPLSGAIGIDIRNAKIVSPEREVAQMLKLESRRSNVAHVTARITREGLPLFLCDSFSAVERVPWMFEAAVDLKRVSVAAAEADIRFDHAQVTVETALLSAWEAFELRGAPGDSCYLTSYVEWAASMRRRSNACPVEFARLVFRSDVRLEFNAA